MTGTSFLYAMAVAEAEDGNVSVTGMNWLADTGVTDSPDVVRMDVADGSGPESSPELFRLNEVGPGGIWTAGIRETSGMTAGKGDVLAFAATGTATGWRMKTCTRIAAMMSTSRMPAAGTRAGLGGVPGAAGRPCMGASGTRQPPEGQREDAMSSHGRVSRECEKDIGYTRRLLAGIVRTGLASVMVVRVRGCCRSRQGIHFGYWGRRCRTPRSGRRRGSGPSSGLNSRS